MRFAGLLLVIGCLPPGDVDPSLDGGVASAPLRDRYARARIEMVRAVNEDRARHGRATVVLDSIATVVAQAHAEEMAAAGWLSHYGASGAAPYERYANAGGTGHVLENVFRWQERSAIADGDDPWERFDVRDAEEWLMASAGHRAAILDPHRTRIGVGIAVDPRRRAVYMVQELVAASATLSQPGRILPGEEAHVEGSMRATGARPLMLVLAREPDSRPWVARGDPPPGGPYLDGGSPVLLVPPWAIRWNPGDRSFSLRLRLSRGEAASRWYGILYAAPEAVVREALATRRAGSGGGWPAAAFMLEVL